LDQIYQRIISIFFYTYPLKASLFFGDYLFLKYYFLRDITYYITLPINFIDGILRYGGLGGFSSLLIFLLVFIGVVRNPRFPYFVRYNACQALLLNIAIKIIIYLFSIFSLSFAELFSVIFVVSLSIFIFLVIQSIYGIEPEIPFISKSVRMYL